MAFIRLLPIVSRVGSSISTLRSYYPSVQLLNNEINKLEKYARESNGHNNLSKELVSYKEDLELKNISFKYEDGDQEIFKNFNFKIIKGKSIAFLGKSGSGKTTLVNIICGLLKPTYGKILVDGKLVNEKITGW